MTPLLSRTATQHADRTFLVDAQTGDAVTFGEAHERALELAAGLAAEGLATGDRVVVALPNSVEHALLDLALLHAGIVAVPLGPGFGVRELRAIVEALRPAACVWADGARERVRDVCADAGVSIIDARSLRGTASAAPAGADDPEAPAAIHFTSGTTGRPRGTVHRLRDFAGNADRLGAALGVGPDHRFHGLLPMTYLGGFYNLLLLPFLRGASVVVDRPFDGRMLLEPWETPMRHGVNALWVPPTILAMLLELDRDEGGRTWCREHIELVMVGMGPLAPELRVRFEEAYGVTLHENYGLAETLIAVSGTPTAPAARGAIGAALPGVEVRVVDDEGRALGAGEEGEIQIATPDLMLGYADGADTVPPALVDQRWLATGDLGVVDDQGQWRITGRRKEIIIRGGINLSPTSIEEALAGHPGVERLAVVGVPHAILGEEPAVLVECRPGHALEDVEPQLRAWARERLDPAQHPGLYAQIDALPLSPSGKVRSRAARQLLVERFGLGPVASSR